MTNHFWNHWFQNPTKLSYYPDIWKKSNIIPVHKKNNKQLVENYRPTFILLISSNFNRIYRFLLEEWLLNPNQFGFCSFDFCINQLLAITNEIFQGLDCNAPLEVRSVFLDISKAFDKVWHERLLYKIRTMGISGELYNLLESYFSGRFQRILNRQKFVVETSFNWCPAGFNTDSTSFSCLYQWFTKWIKI